MISSIEVTSTSDSVTFTVKQQVFFGLIKWTSLATFSSKTDLGQRLLGKNTSFSTKHDWARLGATTALNSLNNGKTDLLEILREVHETVARVHTVDKEDKEI